MRKVVAFALAILTLLTMLVLPVAAAETATDVVGKGTYGTDWLKYGDVDADQKIDAKDALAVLKFTVGKESFSDALQIVANVNKDTEVNAKDALDILKFSVQKITVFEAGVFYQINVIEDQPVGPLVNDYIEKYDKSNSVNGAYTKDTTADTKYMLDVSDLAKNTLYKIASSAWATQAGVADQADIQRLLFSLQGLVNRDFGMDNDHTSTVYVTGGADDTGWLKEMQKAESILASSANNDQGLKVVTVRNWSHIEQHFLPVIKKAGIVLWDGDVPATANVAATICGLDGYLPVLKNSPLHKTLAALGVPVKLDLDNKFHNGKKGQNIVGTNVPSTGSAKNDAYLWALEKYFNRCSTKYIAYTLDGAPTVKGYSAYTDNSIALLGDAGANCLSNHDYLIARRCFFFDLDPYKPAAACDDPAQKNGQADAGTDHQTLIKIFERRYERAKGSFGALMGFIPWWLKYTDHHGHNTTRTGPELEWIFCETLTCYNLAKEADAAHPCSMYNGSLMYKYIPQTKKYENNEKAENITYDPNTYYYTIYVGDYDSSAWLKQHMFNMWAKGGVGDRNRGKVNMMWSINPNLSERVPVVFEYMYNNKSDKDYFAGGDGGAGYIVPEALFTGRTLSMSGLQRPSSYGNGDKTFAQYSKTFYDRFDMKMTGFIINTNHRTLSKEVASAIASYSPLLNLHTCYNNPISRYGSTYFVYCYNELTSKTLSGNMDESWELTHYWSHYMKNGNFGAFRTICWSPKDIDKFVGELDAYFAGQNRTSKYCDPYTYLNMLKAANNAQILG